MELIGRNSKLSLPELPDWQSDPPHGWMGLVPMPLHSFAIPAEHFLFGIEPAITDIAAALDRILPAEALPLVPAQRSGDLLRMPQRSHAQMQTGSHLLLGEEGTGSASASAHAHVGRPIAQVTRCNGIAVTKN